MKTKFFTISFTILLGTILINKSYAQSKDQKSNNEPVFVVIEEKNIEAHKALTLKATVPMQEIGPKMGEMYGKIMGFMGQKGIEISGLPFAVYYTFDPNGNTEFEVGYPLKDKIETTGEIICKEYPAMKVISALYEGPYDKMEPVYNELKKYAEKNKIKLTNISWEIYLTDPAKETDPNKYKTIIYLQVKD